ncbi:GDYXXLXY domain-containing protein [Neobacillus sp. NPDC097160]|uniref:GDYXXLXY domain-containing protein n=1 Tax=Neobacillus sp. NPDC097160 TaxID=3364298 RepID=UPI003814569A
MNKRARQLILGCLVPVLILLGMCFKPVYTLLTGEVIKLQTKPVDPTDLFRGDYVALRYEAEDVPIQFVEEAVVSKLGNSWGEIEVYVLFEEKNGVHIPLKVTLRKPAKGIFLKGTLILYDKTNSGKEFVLIKYGLEKYYVKDNTGTEWEKASEKGKIVAKIKVNNGYGIITGIEREK